MAYFEDEFLSLAGIKHFIFCRRQWALIFIECVWEDNALTIDGSLLHERAHNPYIVEKRGNLIVSRSMPVHSYKMGITGRCDIVEFRRDESGVSLFGRNGRWLPYPVEYKRGHTKKNDADRMQLCAEAMCLEEILACPRIDEASIYYDETKRRETVILDSVLRNNVISAYNEMHEYFSRGHTPRVKANRSCASCSLAGVCLPKLPDAGGSVFSYIERNILKDNP